MGNSLKRILLKAFAISAVLSLLSGACAYKILSMQNEHSASLIFRFTGKDVPRGYTADGSKTEETMKEIKSTAVLTAAAEKIGCVTADELSKGIEIQEVIPAMETEKKDSAMKNGHEYEYFPSEYTVAFSTDNMDLDPKLVLSQISESYFDYYTKNHLPPVNIPSNAGRLVDDGYDFIENADILNYAVEDMKAFLTEMQTSYPNYRSTGTGYTYKELLQEYETLEDWDLAELYSLIIRGQVTKDPGRLLTKLEQRTDLNALYTENAGSDLSETETLLLTYSEKNKVKGKTEKYESDIDNSIDENHTNVLDLVYENDSRPKTAYDDIVLKYISGYDNVGFMQNDSDYYNYLIDAFSGAETASPESQQIISERITELCGQLNELYDIAVHTDDEHREILSVEAVRSIGTPFLVVKYRVKLYTLIFTAGIFVMSMLGLLWLRAVIGSIRNRIIALHSEKPLVEDFVQSVES